MKNRLVYEVRLRPLARPYRSRIHRKWRWDVTYFITTDPVSPGVEDGRLHMGSAFGYEDFKWQALRKIADNIQNNSYKEKYEEV